MISFLANLWLRLRVYWSNYRNKNNITDCQVLGKFDTPFMILGFAVKMYNNFSYTYDDVSELFDSMRYPAECYKRLVNGVFKDDCDGFHAALYHLSIKSGLDAYLLTYITTNIVDSHTVLLIKYYDRYCVIDYTSLISKDSFDEVLKATVDRRHKEEVAHNIVKFNYEQNKYEIVGKEI